MVIRSRRCQRSIWIQPLVAVLLAGAGLIHVQPARAQPFPKGVPATGQALHAAKCAACHNSMMPNGRGEELYDEFNRKLKNAPQLRAMVDFCANRTKSAWFDEEIEHVSRYLNDSYYKFPR